MDTTAPIRQRTECPTSRQGGAGAIIVKRGRWKMNIILEHARIAGHLMAKGIQEWTRIPPKSLRYKKTCIIRRGSEFSEEYIQHGYQYLGDFDVVVVRRREHTFHLSNMERGVDYALAKRELSTMYAPVFSSDIVWMKRKGTDSILDWWRRAEDQFDIALTVGVYKARPFIWMLPADIGEEVHEVVNGVDVYACKHRDDWRAGVFDNGRQIWGSVENAYKKAEDAVSDAIGRING